MASSRLVCFINHQLSLVGGMRGLDNVRAYSGSASRVSSVGNGVEVEPF